jgi:hypothetical protein
MKPAREMTVSSSDSGISGTPLREHSDWFSSEDGHKVPVGARTWALSDIIFGTIGHGNGANGTLFREILREACGDVYARRHCAIWNSLFLRTSAIPLDSVLSTMGLLEVQLDPSDFLDRTHPRFCATIRMMQVYLQKGGRAHWLAITYMMAKGSPFPIPVYGPSARFPAADLRMCTVPYKRELNEVKKYEENEARFTEQNKWLGYLKCPPTGILSDQGYLTIEVPVLEMLLKDCLTEGAIATLERNSIPFNDKTCWVVDLGAIVYESPATNIQYAEYRDYRACLLLSTHASDRYHVIGTADLLKLDWGKASMRSVAIGGPRPIENCF